MKKIIPLLLFLLFLLFSITASCAEWGQTGHRVIGLIAEKHLTKKTLRNIRKILGNETLAEVSNYMDFIRSDKKYKHMDSWHYMTVRDEEQFEKILPKKKPSKEGDLAQIISQLIDQLKSKDFTEYDEVFALKCLIHLIGDLHQPLHVGNGKDKGGNDLTVIYFWTKSNLHRVWDSGIINNQKYSYTEYVNWIDHASPQQIATWKNASLTDWINESKNHRKQCYETLPEDKKKKINYKYNFENIELINQRLLQAGIRLAHLLNEIYG